ncbi:restriction endonuclease subunit S [Microbacterium paraoxydans]|uniref:restriction endonuclease subunit S n=1 Tax=Microbacterium paraoxydans TaxID=199592 RepID=UPI00352D999F
MTIEWNPTRLGEVVKIKHGFAFSGMAENADPSLPVVVGIGNFDYAGGFRFGSTTVKRFIGNYPPEFALTPGDVLLAMTCQTAGGEILGIPGTVPDDGQTYLHNQRLGKVEVLDPTRIDLRYFFQLARWQPFNHYLFATASGSKILHTAPGRIEDFVVNLPSLPEQRSIAATLSALDEKIESNRRASKLISELVLARFRAVVLENDFSLVPLGKLTNAVKGRSYKSAELADSTTALVTLKSIDRNGGYKADGLKPYTGDYKPSQVVAPGEIVVAQTDLTQGAEVVGRGVRVPASAEYETLVASLDLTIVRPADGMPVEYLLGLLTSDDFREWCRSRVTGTTVLHLAKDVIPSWPAPLVSPEKQRAFADDVGVLYQRLDSLAAEASRLIALRDALLPELLSGRIRAVDPEGQPA